MSNLAPASETSTTQPHRPAEPLDPRKPGTSPHVAYLMGLPRSGTTLLGYLMAGGDSQLALSEPYLAFDLFGRLRRPIFFNHLAKKTGLRSVPVPTGPDEAAFAAYLSRLAAVNDLRHVVIKETFRARREWANADLLTRLVEVNQNVIAIQRHPYDVAVSSIRFCKNWRGITGRLVRLAVPRLPLFPNDRVLVEHVADEWRSFHEWCHKHDIAVLRYEDLVQQPEHEMRRACDACRIDYQPQMLDHTHPRGAFGGIGSGSPAPTATTGQHTVGRAKALAP